MGFLGAVHSELVKVKHTPFWTMHLCLPVVGALLFIVYYGLNLSTNMKKATERQHLPDNRQTILLDVIMTSCRDSLFCLLWKKEKDL